MLFLLSKKKLKSDGILFSGKASDEVTGSQYFVRFAGYQCLLECGLHQSSSNSYLDSYKINSEKFKFKPKDIDFVFIAHPHVDHCGLVPRLVKEGFCGQIITTRNTALIMKPLLLNSCYILNEEARILSKKYKREYKPLYSDDDVYNALDLIEIFDEYNTTFKLNDVISFQWFRNSHCIGAAQLQLILNNQCKTRKILYTSDIGSLQSKNHYVSNTELPTEFNDVVLLESTYGNPERQSKKLRKNDVEHLRVAIDTVMNRNGTVLLPCFSFSRTQEILTTLYDIYGGDESFKHKIIVDSKLSCDISKLYSSVLCGEDLEEWERVFHWKNIKFISEKSDSQSCISDPSPKIIVSSSGFCTNGRIINYLKRYISDERSMVIFSGYAGNNSSYLSYRIKNCKEHKFVSINKEKFLNKADCITLSTFSSHADHDDLVKFGSSVNTTKLVLVHGSKESKDLLKRDLECAISKNNKTHRVISSYKDMVVDL